MWDLWWTKWHCDTFFSEFFSFPPANIISQWLSMLTYHLEDEQRPLDCRSSDTWSLPINMNMNSNGSDIKQIRVYYFPTGFISFLRHRKDLARRSI
jgi:hypothetical protein